MIQNSSFPKSPEKVKLYFIFLLILREIDIPCLVKFVTRNSVFLDIEWPQANYGASNEENARVRSSVKFALIAPKGFDFCNVQQVANKFC